MSLRLLDYAAPVLRAAREGAELSQMQIAERAGGASIVADAVAVPVAAEQVAGTAVCRSRSEPQREQDENPPAPR